MKKKREANKQLLEKAYNDKDSNEKESTTKKTTTTQIENDKKTLNDDAKQNAEIEKLIRENDLKNNINNNDNDDNEQNHLIDANRFVLAFLNLLLLLLFVLKCFLFCFVFKVMRILKEVN